jgi:hypothetical protein
VISPVPPINRTPLGILDFLGIKNGGQYPQTMPAVLSPTWDMHRWYLEYAAVQESTPISVDNGDRGAQLIPGTFQVPSDVTAYYVWDFGFYTALLAAGQTIRVSFFRNKPNNLDTCPLRTWQGNGGIPLSAGGLDTYQAAGEGGFLLYPGESIGVSFDNIQDAGAGAIAGRASIRFTRIGGQ